MKATSILFVALVASIVGCSDPKPARTDLKTPEPQFNIDKPKTDKPAGDVVPKSPQ